MPALEGAYVPIFGVGVAHAIQALVSILVFKPSAKIPKFLFIVLLTVPILLSAFFVRKVAGADFVGFTVQYYTAGFRMHNNICS